MGDKEQGLSGGTRGDYTISECVQNIVDVARWAKVKFAAPLFIAGGSVGGALTYYAAQAGVESNAIACLNLFDFGSGDAILLSRMAPLASIPATNQLLYAAIPLLKPLEWLHVPSIWVALFEKLMDERDGTFQAQWDADPIPPRTFSVRSMMSQFSTPPAVPLEENTVPTLVINQTFDKMTDPAVTQNNYERLGGLKRYVEIPYSHWSSQPEFWQAIVAACDDWFQCHLQDPIV